MIVNKKLLDVNLFNRYQIIKSTKTTALLDDARFLFY